MNSGYRVIAAMGFLLASLCACAQAGDSASKVVLPNPRLIHCRSAECSQLWQQVPGNRGVVYPAQVLTDIVNGEVVGLTAVYEKSVSEEEIRKAINVLYARWTVLGGLWRVEPEELVVQLAKRNDGTKTVIYLKVADGYGDLEPSAHINSPHTDCDK